MKADLFIHSATQLCVVPHHDGGPQRGRRLGDLGIIEDGALACADGRVVAVGRTETLRADWWAPVEIDASERVVCPGFVDPHTHVVWAGDRADEEGASGADQSQGERGRFRIQRAGIQQVEDREHAPPALVAAVDLPAVVGDFSLYLSSPAHGVSRVARESVAGDGGRREARVGGGGCVAPGSRKSALEKARAGRLSLRAGRWLPALNRPPVLC